MLFSPPVGYVRLDLKVRESCIESFSRFPPLFKKVEVSFDELQDDAKEYALKHKLWSRNEKRTLLKACMQVEQHLVSTRLLKWYLDRNIVDWANVTEFIEFDSAPVFATWGQQLIDRRVEAECQGHTVRALLYKFLGWYQFSFV